jgi:hypothetical protein
MSRLFRGRPPPENEKRGPGEETAHLENTTAHGFNLGLDHKQEAADAQLSEHLADLRFRRAVERLHRLGPRALYEMLVALGASRLIRTEIERQVERHAALDPHIVCAVGGDRFACAPIHLVPP